MQTPRISEAERSIAVHSLGQVLIVEDEDLLAQTFVRVVARAGGHGKAVGTARAAFEQLRDHATWSAVVLDEVLPDGSGLEILGRIRVTDQNIPALLVTGLRSEEDLPNRAFELQARLLYKPISNRHLEQFLREIGEFPTDQPRADVAIRGELPGDLRALVREVLRAADEEGRAHADYAYRVAILARAVSNRTEYGQHVAMTCAIAANVSRSELQRFITLTTHWTPGDIRTLLRHRDARGRSITVHHLLSILTAPPNVRSQLERTVREAQDLDEIRSLLRSVPSPYRRIVGRKSH